MTDDRYRWLWEAAVSAMAPDDQWIIEQIAAEVDARNEVVADVLRRLQEQNAMFRQVLDDIRRATAAGVKIVRVNIEPGGATVEVGQ